MLHLMGICIGFIKDGPRGTIATRTVGGVIAGMGVWFLYQAVGS
jgi:hydrogenase/urease accessory protein HupE